jgi:hydroxymethylpyrimidine pyrophosphatase-like HAD family hydrolase
MTFGGDLAALAMQGVNKIVCVEDDEGLLTDIRSELEAIDALQVTSSWVNNLELMPNGVDKGLAVREAALEWGIDLSQVMVIGDYDNDVELLKAAGFAVAVANAPARVQRCADLVTGSCMEGGVAMFLNALMEQKLGKAPV